MEETQEKLYYDKLQTIEKLVFELDENKVQTIVQQTINIFDSNFKYSFNLMLCQLIYSSFLSQKKNVGIYFQYLKALESKEEEKIQNSISSLIDILRNFLLSLTSQESNYLLEQMINFELMQSKFLNKKSTLYFVHHKTEKEIKHLLENSQYKEMFTKDFEELQKDDWKLHKKLINEGVNTLEISKAIRNDNIEKLQEISSVQNFDYNQKVPPSLYERYSFINNDDISLIEYSAFFGSIKCFKYLLLNGAKLEKTGKFAAVGGNIEIIHLCEQNNVSFEGSDEPIIEFHRNDIFHYFHEKHYIDINKINELGRLCIKYYNYEIFNFFIVEEKMVIDDAIIFEAIRIGNIYLIKYFLKSCILPKGAMFEAAQSGNVEVVEFICNVEKIDVNEKNVFLFNLIFILIF